jgi:hypothetical protein
MSMRKLPPAKAIAHALGSITAYPRQALRIGMVWIPVLLLIELAQEFLGQPNPAPAMVQPPGAVDLLSAAVGLVAFSSMAVSWNRFILRDEPGIPWRLDRQVLRYAGNSLLIILMIAVPVLVMVFVASLLPALAILLLPLSIVTGTVVTILSVKLPAVALGRTDFSFGMAWAACAGNFWQVLAVFLLNAAIVLGLMVAAIIVTVAAESVSSVLATAVRLAIDAAMALFLSLFNASVFTSLYGFFVERRDF